MAVVGSGAAGLVAACRAADGGHSVVVLEKADLLGGTSAVSGGVMWMPNHHLMGADYPDSDEAALAYLTAATGGTGAAEHPALVHRDGRGGGPLAGRRHPGPAGRAAPTRLPHRLGRGRARSRAGQPAVRRQASSPG